MASFDKNGQPLVQRLVVDLNSSRKIDSEGKITYRGIGFGRAESLLADLLKFDPAIPGIERHRMVRRALFGPSSGKRLTLNSVCGQASRLEQEYLALPERRLVLITSASLHRLDPIPGCRMAGTAISFPRSLPRGFSGARSEAVERASQSLHSPYPNNYRWVRVSVHERSAAAAAERALDSLSLLFGLWNLALNYGQSRMSLGGPRKPVNELALGPIHSVHTPSGAAEGSVLWYESDYVSALPVKHLGNKAAKMIVATNTMRTCLRRCPYRSMVEGCIRSYSRALGERDWSTSFVRLWQTLELATNSRREQYKVTVRRASFLYRDPGYNAAVLNHLRDWRNRLVHSADTQDEEIETKLYLLKSYVENLIRFHIFDGRQFASLEDVTDYLDLPSSSSEVARRLSLLKMASGIERGAKRA